MRRYAFQYSPFDEMLTKRTQFPISREYSTSYEVAAWTGHTTRKWQLAACLNEGLRDMLNAKALGDLLTQNVHPVLSPRWFVMSPAATLLAYSQPHNVRDIRDQATLVSMVWREQLNNLRSLPITKSTSKAESQPEDGALETLTIEFEGGNIIARAVQPHLLLVLVGGNPTGSSEGFNLHAEVRGAPRYPAKDWRNEFDSSTPNNPSSSLGSNKSSRSHSPQIDQSNTADGEAAKARARQQTKDRERKVHLGILDLQRKKIDAATEYIRQDFDQRHFVMPDDSHDA